MLFAWLGSVRISFFSGNDGHHNKLIYFPRSYTLALNDFISTLSFLKGGRLFVKNNRFY